jgi:hypothetical protein
MVPPWRPAADVDYHAALLPYIWIFLARLAAALALSSRVFDGVGLDLMGGNPLHQRST